MKKLVIVGGIGNGAVALSTVVDINNSEDGYDTWEVLGFLNDSADKAQVEGFPWLGPIESASVHRLRSCKDVYFLWTLFSTQLRQDMAVRLLGLGIEREKWATLVHPTAVVSRFAEIRRGVIVHPLSCVGPGVVIGDHVQLFGQSFVGHDTRVRNYAYLANGARISSFVTLDEGAYIGMGASVREFVQVGKWAIVGMGAVVLENVEPHTTVVGVPAREIRRGVGNGRYDHR